MVESNIRELFNSSKMLRAQVAEDTERNMKLKNNVEIRVLASDARNLRGPSIAGAALLDEFNFLRGEDGPRSDYKIIEALQPKVRACNARLIIISSKSLPRGYCWDMHKRHWGVNKSDVLV